jgi:hypothetical protein
MFVMLERASVSVGRPISKGCGMKRQLNLRQVEAFKAVIEQGTVSRAAEILFVSQPAVSKLLAHLEDETGAGPVRAHPRQAGADPPRHAPVR